MFLSSPEYDTLQVKGILNDARGGDPNPQHILLGGKVGWLSDPIQRVQVTSVAERRNEPGEYLLSREPSKSQVQFILHSRV